MKRLHGPSALAAAVLMLVAVAAALASCGDAQTARDPLVGTYRQLADDAQTSMAPLIITKTDSGYLATAVFWGGDETPASPRPTLAVSLTREGDKLRGRYPPEPGGDGQGELKVEITVLPQSGRITWANSRTDDGPLDDPIEMAKVSDSTAYPTTK